LSFTSDLFKYSLAQSGHLLRYSELSRYFQIRGRSDFSFKDLTGRNG